VVGVAEAPGATLADILTEHGPLHQDDIARRLRERGVADPDAVLRELRLEIVYPARQLVDERWVWLPTVLPGRVLTHRVNADELAHDILTVNPDLDPITTLCDHEQYQRFADGSTAQVVLPDYDDELLEERGIPDEAIAEVGALLLAPGALAALGVAEGDLIGVRLTEQGLALERPTELGAHTAVGARLAATLDPDKPIYFSAAMWTVCVEDPTAFTEPLAPLCEIADDLGLAHNGDWLVPGGFDFGRWRFEGRCTLLATVHDLDPDDAIALQTLIELHRGIAELPDAEETPDQLPELVGELGAALADPRLAELLVAETVNMYDDGAAALGMLAELLEPRVPRPARVACRWLRSVALERGGDIEAAERELLAAESMDPDWPLPLFDLARIASDRGDAERGLSLLHRAGAEPDDPLVELLEQHRTEPRSDLGRNELCWCGSGRKYKKCHLGREQLPLPQRVRWLYAKGIQHALAGWGDLLTEVGYERCRYVDDPDVVQAALDDPLVMDAVLFEGGAFEEFLEVRGSLLPDDERLLAEQWLLAERSVFELEQVQPGRGVTLRDLRTGDTHEVQERMASRLLKSGQLICARPIPVGDDTMQFFGGVEPVALHQRDRLLDLLDTEPDAVTLVAELSRRFAPPTLVNTEGEPLAICEATVRVGDPDGIEAALDNTYDRIDGDEPQWFENVEIEGTQRVRASLSLDGDMLEVSASSEKRMDRVLSTLAGLDPAMQVLDDSRRPLRDARDAAELAEEFGVGEEDELDDDDPKVAAALEEFIRDYEIKWLDLPIPALDGHTPRQAADDPTRRGDLIKLLDSFPADGAARGGMDVDRLRAALGL
jgi:hypothetical protein